MQNQKPINVRDKVWEVVLAKYSAGYLTINEVSALTGVTVRSLRKYLPSSYKVRQSLIPKIVEEYVHGLTARLIARRYFVNESTVIEILRSHGVLRNKSQAGRLRYSIERAAFPGELVEPLVEKYRSGEISLRDFTASLGLNPDSRRDLAKAILKEHGVQVRSKKESSIMKNKHITEALILKAEPVISKINELVKRSAAF